MPDKIVINTSPLIALTAAWGNLEILASLYTDVLVPFEVGQELLAGGLTGFAVSEYNNAHWLQKYTEPLTLTPLLANSLDIGEASVIQLALNENLKTVCIDEAAGRRVARLSGLELTGAVGVLLRAKKEGHQFLMKEAIQRMQNRGIWLSQRVVTFALTQAGESIA